MDKPPRKGLPGWSGPSSRRKRKTKADVNQLALHFPVTEARLPLREKTFFLPRNKQDNQWQVLEYWREVVARKDLLKQLAKDQRIRRRPGHGLIYRHLINGKVRYIGQTSRQSLRDRFRQRFKSGLIGYDYEIQRCLLNAFWRKAWKIRVEQVKLQELNRREEELIRFYASLNRLWNQEHNPHFKPENFYS